AATAGNVNIVLKDTTRFTIQGQATVETANRTGLQIELSFAPAELALISDAYTSASIDYGGGGAFRIRGVSPGSYVIRAMASDGMQRYFSDGIRVIVTDRDVDRLQVPLFPTVDAVSGRLLVDGGRPLGNPTRGGAITVSLISAEDPRRTVSAAMEQVGAFTLHDVA